jgi:hypothetical protein
MGVKQPFEINLAHPRVQARLGAAELDLANVLWVVSNEKAWAEGLVDMELWADFSWPEIRFGNGWASSRPNWHHTLTDPNKGRAVVLHLPDSAQQLDNWLRMRDPRFQDSAVLAPIRQQIVGTISDFHVDEFRADFSRSPDGKQVTAIRLHGGGKEMDQESRTLKDTHRLDLTVAATDVDILVSHFLKVKNEGQGQASAAAATQQAEPATQPSEGKAGSQ